MRGSEAAGERFNKYNLLTDCVDFDIISNKKKKIQFEIDTLLISEYKAIAFYEYFRLILCY